MILPDHPYWPCAPKADGSLRWAEYRSYRIQGYAHSDTLALDVYQKEYLPGHDFRRTMVPLAMPQYPAVAIVYTPAGISAPADWLNKNDTLCQGLWKDANGLGFIGESGSFGASWDGDSTVCFPPEPELPLDITSYKTILSGTSKSYKFDKVSGAQKTEDFDWQFRNLGEGPWWWHEWYPNQLRTALWESPTDPQRRSLYNYLFAKGVPGPINVWWGLVKADGTLDDASRWSWEIINYN